jgi:hypothetical protein
MRRPFNRVIDTVFFGRRVFRASCFSGVPENAIPGANKAHMTAPLKEQRRQDCTRRH